MGPQAAGIRDREGEQSCARRALREFFENRNQLPGIFSASGRIPRFQVHIAKGIRHVRLQWVPQATGIRDCKGEKLREFCKERNQHTGIFTVDMRISRSQTHIARGTRTKVSTEGRYGNSLRNGINSREVFQSSEGYLEPSSPMGTSLHQCLKSSHDYRYDWLGKSEQG